MTRPSHPLDHESETSFSSLHPHLPLGLPHAQPGPCPCQCPPVARRRITAAMPLQTHVYPCPCGGGGSILLLVEWVSPGPEPPSPAATAQRPGGRAGHGYQGPLSARLRRGTGAACVGQLPLRSGKDIVSPGLPASASPQQLPHPLQ